MQRTVLQQIATHGHRRAIIANGTAQTYTQLVGSAVSLSSVLKRRGEIDRPVLFMAGRNHTYPIAQWGIWNAGAMAVPIYPQHPTRELEYIAQDSGASVVIIDPQFAEKIKPVAASCDIEVVCLDGKFMEVDEDTTESQLSEFSGELDRRAMMLYTSGTTGRPKGVVHSHRNVLHHVTDLVKAWEWTPEDHILHFLPLHHAHGIINKFLCPMWAGARCDFLETADATLIWARLADSHRRDDQDPFTIFMAVPTIYHRMLEALEHLDPQTRAAALAAVRKLRVTVCGSAACPPSVIQAWEKCTGHRLLERYGMTELGMALSNPLHGSRHAGFVGQPLPSVEVRVVDPSTGTIVPPGEQGELRVRGPTVFQEYWGNPAATAKEFDAAGWFKTGDVARYDAEKASYQILGRASVDIIKSGAYKISALEIEREVLEHPSVSECVVFGAAHAEFGEEVVAVLRVAVGSAPEAVAEHRLREWLRSRLASYKLPRQVHVLAEIPKNAMGKVNKKELRDALAAASVPGTEPSRHDEA